MVHIWTGVPHSISSPWQLATPHSPELGGLFCKTNTTPSAMTPNAPIAMMIFLYVGFIVLLLTNKDFSCHLQTGAPL
jgi:hypothetical protein